MASSRHPYAPEIPINHANMLSRMGLSDEAESTYQKAISLQGQMEAGFRAHYHYSQHLLRKSIKLREIKASRESLIAAQEACENIEIAIRLTQPWVIHHEGRNLRIFIHENLGLAKEAKGDSQGALAAYDFAASIQTGNRAHYRAAVLIGRMGRDEWAQRRAPQALYKFNDARRRLVLAGKELPEGVTLDQRLEFTNYLDQSIALLKEANVEPKP
jgi:tetratricopeptide (TPR) repeat protein